MHTLSTNCCPLPPAPTRTDLTPARGLLYPFDRVVRTQLAGSWHTLSWRTRQAVKDLGTVSELARVLMTTDAVSFLRWVQSACVGGVCECVSSFQQHVPDSALPDA
jgi:hypothetical protein